MREIRLSGSEGGETAIKAVFPTPIREEKNSQAVVGQTGVRVKMGVWPAAIWGSGVSPEKSSRLAAKMATPPQFSCRPR